MNNDLPPSNPVIRPNDKFIAPASALVFVQAFNFIKSEAHQNSIDKGFWDELQPPNMGEKIALIHEEISECLTAIRHKNPPDKDCPEFTNAEIELADAIIRIMDLAHYKSWRVAEALIAKMRFNKSRPHKHGKQF